MKKNKSNKSNQLNKTHKILILLFIFVTVIVMLSFNYYYKVTKITKLPKIAIVLDDWGYNLNNVSAVKSLGVPVTLAILPNLKYSSEIAGNTDNKNIQVILHMPMEPERHVRLEKDTLMTAMSGDQIKNAFNKALNNVSGAKGISNHMGSKFTADMRSMNILFEQLKKKNIFFLDSVSCDDSVSEVAASKFKVKHARRDVFLDNKNEITYIQRQFMQLVEIAKRRGYAIGVGHDRQSTLLAIKKLLPSLKGKVRFVFASELTS